MYTRLKCAVFTQPNGIPVRISLQKEFPMTVAKVTEIIASSNKSFDDAILTGVGRAHKTLKNLKSAWVKDQEVKLNNEGQIVEYRVQLKITFILED
jgi:dodecin